MTKPPKKTYNTEPLLRQRKAVEKLVENGGNISKAMRDAGYSPETAKSPKKLTESKGYKQIMEEYGLTDELIVTSLVEDIKAKPGMRTSELQLASKIKGLQVERVDVTSNGEKLNFPVVRIIDERTPDTKRVR